MMIDGLYSSDSINSIYNHIKDIQLFEGEYFILPKDFEAHSNTEKGLPNKEVENVLINDYSDTVSTKQAKTSIPLDIDSFRESISGCLRCELGKTRRNFVFGAGSKDADIMFVGEAPGHEEDRTGEPFVGPAGELLTKIIEAIDLTRKDVYICNILKCRPPNNRDPRIEEIKTCEPYLAKQIEIIAPRVICTLGRFAAQTLLDSNEPMGRMRLATNFYKDIPLVATYHPAALLRNPQWKRPTWEDMKKVRRLYDGVEL